MTDPPETLLNPATTLGKWVVCVKIGILFRAEQLIVRNDGRNELRGVTPDGTAVSTSMFMVLHNDQQYLLRSLFHPQPLDRMP